MAIYKHARFVVDKKHPSLNKIYSSKHWTYRSKEKSKWRGIFSEMLDIADLRTNFSIYELDVVTNNRYDIDNDIMLVKFFNDALVEKGLVQDDSRKYFKHFAISHSDELDKYTSVINLYYR